MNCAECRGKTAVAETRRNGTVVIRRRVCEKCGGVVYTEERVIPDTYGKRMIGALRETYYRHRGKAAKE